MGFRRSKREVAGLRKWKQFIIEHFLLTQEIDLPTEIIEDEYNWTDILAYGYPESARTGSFYVKDLNPELYQKFLSLVEKYFEAGFAYIEPFALTEPDRTRLRQRFDPNATYLKYLGRERELEADEEEWA
jgi:hypothetical protein